MVKKIFILLMLPCLAMAATSASKPVKTPVLPIQQLAKTLGALKTLQANFEQVVIARNKIIAKSSGEIAFQRPGKFRWETKAPISQLIVADGFNIWVYDKDLQQATHKKIDYQQIGMPALLLSGSTDELQQFFEVTKVRRANLGILYELKPKEKNSLFSKVQLFFINGQINSMDITDNLGQNTEIKFFNVIVNRKLPSKMFTFIPPKNVDVI